ncbi:hypothetical protein MRS95_22780 [Escherichia coli]|uniref:Protein YtgB n=1 Tax=Escherichia coli (strain K12) TaxID=83333 RepID=YTGB_ECOLI|nr:protein YtgB [Escherichia coli str. K-12 substr. MG1655] [Escherichia coli]YP_010283919.1 protein YtgB [Escherichia coli str. K-12 substr. MG1655]P0DV21.1 RecName: Full=Protein YtgB [Escherichia coli K-12]MCI6422962.1 hypothetical protein [Shigella flexneri]MCI6598604.1 hypothetical protein [Shigella dysenteriae]MDC3429076.1 hypothetical protein [Escherichia sp. S10b]MCI4468412.1 hypothetical protein [Escherichia coli]MCI4471990.1 hypothetical protein [Escherichia coli]
MLILTLLRHWHVRTKSER